MHYCSLNYWIYKFHSISHKFCNTEVEDEIDDVCSQHIIVDVLYQIKKVVSKKQLLLYNTR